MIMLNLVQKYLIFCRIHPRITLLTKMLSFKEVTLIT